MPEPAPSAGKPDLLAALARRWGCTTGQAWTLAVAALLAIVLGLLTIPVAFR